MGCLLRGDAQRQDHCETGPFRSWLKGEFTPKTAHDRPRNVETKAAGFCPSLKWPKEIFRRTHSDTGVFETNCDLSVLLACSDTKAFCFGGHHGSLAVLSQIQKDLNQPIAVGPNQGQRFLNIPLYLDLR